MLTDDWGRRFPYVRLSLTEACNFRCTYCLPDGYQPRDKPTFLQPHEIENLMAALVDLGVQKVRLTGGEPTLRPDLLPIMARISGHSAIKTLSMTTNGYRLERDGVEWVSAGLNALNVSIDSLRTERFLAITGHDKLTSILKGIEAVRGAGLKTLKINVVWLKGQNDDELSDFIHFSKEYGVPVRFIELMQTGQNRDYFTHHHLSAQTIEDQLLALGFTPKPRGFDDGPARSFTKDGADIGLIAPYSKDFCTTCNRLRISARGALKLCLFGEGGLNLRPLLQDKTQKDALIHTLKNSLGHKAVSHQLHQGHTGDTPHLASIGG